jgi:acyl-CoA thioester hydrolase
VSTTPERFVHHIPVRYGEIDMQGVVFNAHYLAYCDDAVEHWMRHCGVRAAETDWDFMLRRATVEWSGSAGLDDVIDIAVGVDRWGTTSFDVGFHGQVGERPVFDAVITYVGVVRGTTQTMAPPADIRAALSGEGR